MNTASVDKNKVPWVISATDQPPALEIVLRRQTVILSWNQFVYAEGGADEVGIGRRTRIRNSRCGNWPKIAMFCKS